MSSSLTLKVASLTSTHTPTVTDSEVAQILRWFIADTVDAPPEGLTQAQLNQYYLDFAAAELVRYIRAKAARNRERILNAERGDVATQAAAETAF